MIYAGFWRRLCAHLIDASIQGICVWMIFAIAAVGFGIVSNNEIKTRHHAPAIGHKITPMANDYTTAYPENTPAVTPAPAPQVNPSAAAPAPAALDAAQPVITPYSTPDMQAPVAGTDQTDEAQPAPFAGHYEGAESDEEKADDATAMLAVLLLYPLIFIVSAIYHTLFVAGRWQATPGKRVMGCMVVTKEGARLTKLHALGRHLSCAVSCIILYVGFMLIGWTREKTGLHDLIAGTRVVRTKNSDPVIATKDVA